MVIGFAGSGAQIFLTRKLAVHDNLAVVQADRPCEAAHASCCRAHFFFIRELNGVFRNIQRVYQLRHVQFPVASDKGRHIAVFFSLFIIGNKQQRFHCLRLWNSQEIRYFFDCLCPRSMHFLQRQLRFR